MSKHSLGPWRYDGGSIRDATGQQLLANDDVMATEADKVLMASAPEMLELLRMAGRAFDGDASSEAWREQFDALLKRLEG